MKFQHPAIARAALLQAKFRAHAPQLAPTAVAPGIAQLEARADDLRQRIIGYEAQLKDPILTAELNFSAQYEALIDEADEEISAIEAQLDALEEKAEIEAPARKFYYSNTAYRNSVDTEYYGRGYVSSRGKNYRSCHVWRVGKPDQPVDECNDRYQDNDEGGDLFYDEDGEPRFVALCESAAMATALCALLNADDSDFLPAPKNECGD